MHNVCHVEDCQKANFTIDQRADNTEEGPGNDVSIKKLEQAFGLIIEERRR